MKPLRGLVVVLVMATMVLPGSARAEDPICDYESPEGTGGVFVVVPPTCDDEYDNDAELVAGGGVYLPGVLEPQPDSTEGLGPLPDVEATAAGAGACETDVHLKAWPPQPGGTWLSTLATLDCFANIQTSKLIVRFQRKNFDGTWNTLKDDETLWNGDRHKQLQVDYFCKNKNTRVYRGFAIGKWTFSNGAIQTQKVRSKKVKGNCA